MAANSIYIIFQQTLKRANMQSKNRSFRTETLNTFQRFFQISFSIFLLILSSIIAASAQTDQGQISGIVTDANDAVIAGATISVTNEKTGETRTATVTDDEYF